MKLWKEKLWSYLTLIWILACLSGCATNSCFVQPPIYPSKQDVLTRGTKQQILTHDETWEQLKKGN